MVFNVFFLLCFLFSCIFFKFFLFYFSGINMKIIKKISEKRIFNLLNRNTNTYEYYNCLFYDYSSITNTLKICLCSRLTLSIKALHSKQVRSLNEWFDFFTYLFDDSEETSDNAKTDEKYLICRNCEVIVAASEDVAHKDGIVIYKNTTTKPMELDTTEALQDPKKEEGE
ncbi:uncharacterized protein ACN2A1_009106 isoform 1-T1 [Glossina fuscipes fuscipes]